MLMGDVAQGHIPIIAGDIKAEYVGFVHQVGGQVVTIGHGAGTLNPLDVGALGRVIPQLEAKVTQLRADGDTDKCEEMEALLERAREHVHGRQVNVVSLGRGEPIRDWESMLVSVALPEIYESETIDWDNPPVLAELIDYLQAGSEQLMDKGRARDKHEWDLRIDDLMLSLNSLLDGPTGRIFAGQTSTPIRVDATAVCIDVSAIDRGDKAMKSSCDDGMLVGSVRCD